MTDHPATHALEESLAGETSTPCTWRPDRENYLAEQSSRLREAVLNAPITVTAVASDWAQQYCGQSNEVRHFVAVARTDDTWLLFDPKTAEFAKAFGASDQPEPLSLLGFASRDALAEWLG
jgi:hypothetical protein